MIENIDEIASKTEVYPNPTASRLYLKTDNHLAPIKSTESTEVLFSKALQTMEGIQVEQLDAGIYFLQPQSASDMLTCKFVKN